MDTQETLLKGMQPEQVHQLPDWLEPDTVDYTRYGLLQPPFSLTTDPSFMYLSDAHKMD